MIVSPDSVIIKLTFPEWIALGNKTKFKEEFKAQYAEAGILNGKIVTCGIEIPKPKDWPDQIDGVIVVYRTDSEVRLKHVVNEVKKKRVKTQILQKSKEK